MPLPAGKTEIKEGKLNISGLYQCVATNSFGTKKATMNLFVQSRPAGLYSARYADLIYHDKTFFCAKTLGRLVYKVVSRERRTLFFVLSPAL